MSEEIMEKLLKALKLVGRACDSGHSFTFDFYTSSQSCYIYYFEEKEGKDEAIRILSLYLNCDTKCEEKIDKAIKFIEGKLAE